MKYALLALLLVASAAGATNKPNPPQTSGDNEFSSHANASSGSSSNAGAVGVGIGLGTGGDGGNSTSTASGGAGGHGGNGYGGNAVGLGGSGGDSSSAVNDSGNSFNANTAKGGSAHQSQGQSLNSANLLRMTSENKVNASSANDNRSSASGNTTVTNVGGDSTLVERNAPPVFLGALTPTSCGGGFNAGGSSRDGAGSFGIQWVGKECRMRMIGDRYHALGMVDTACEVYKATKGFNDAAKANPKLRDLDCTIKPVPAAVVAPVPVLVAPELAPRVPRG